MNKKILSLVLALVMVLGTFTSVFAASTTKEEVKSVPKITSNDAKIQWLVDNGMVSGRTVNADAKNNDLALDKNIQRAEVTKMLVYAIGKQDLASKLQGVMQPYSDVTPTYWANGFITVGSTSPSPANGLPFLHGYLDGSFKPTNDVTYAELAKMLVVLVKKDLTADMVKEAAKAWPTKWMAWAAEEGILEGLTIADTSKAANRHDAFVMLFNAFYKMKDLRVLPSNETMGIISKQTKGDTLVLNQGEFKKDFKVNDNTVFVQDGTKTTNLKYWVNMNLNNNNYFVGSLVRVLTDKEGVVTHIIQLGNPQDLALDNTGWISVADSKIESKAVTIDKDLNTIKFPFTNTINTNSKTRYFVADVAKDQLTEVKGKAAALKMLDGKTTIENVYAGYDKMPTSGRLEATVVVFNTVYVNGFDTNTVRVVTPGDTTFNLMVENPGATKTETVALSTRTNDKVFPFNYNLEKYDVIKAQVKDGKFIGDRNSIVLIDHSEDPIYQVTKVNNKEVDGLNTSPLKRIDTIELTDGKGKATFDVKIDSKNFFTDEIKVGSFVQVHAMKDTKDTIFDIISVVPDTKTRGELPAGRATDNRQVTGTIVKVTGVYGDYATFTVKVTNDDGTVSNYTTNYVTKEPVAKFEGKEVTFIADKSATEGHAYPYASNIIETANSKALTAATEAVDKAVKDPTQANVDAAKAAIAKVTDTAKKAELEKKLAPAVSTAKQDAFKAAVTKANVATPAVEDVKAMVEAYNALNATEKAAVKAELVNANKAIDAYNNIDPTETTGDFKHLV